MSGFCHCSEINAIKRELAELLPDWFERYSDGNLNIALKDESVLMYILKKYIRTHVDFHLFYRWIRLDSDWAVVPPYAGLSPSIFWTVFYQNSKGIEIIKKLVEDYKKVHE